MPKYTLNLNGKKQEVDVAEDTPLLWVLRDSLDLVGTKYGCGKAACGACTVHIDGVAIRSCSISMKMLKEKPITTIEGDGPEIEAVKKAWKEHVVPQCGYCQPGFIMATAALLKNR